MSGCKSGILLPDQKDLVSLFKYDKDTGDLIWNTGRSRGSKASPSGGLYVRLNGKFNRTNYKKSRLIWRLVTGEDPGTDVIDHIDSNNRNNSWSNLRRVTQSVNAQNRKARGKYLKGVIYRCGWYYTQIHNKHVAKFKTELEAHKHYTNLVESYRR